MHKTTAAVGLPRSLIHTKLYRPRSGSDVIPRARLMERLNARLNGNATLVCAPAGFGKTTLVANGWRRSSAQQPGCHSMKMTTSWLSLSAPHLAALHTVFPEAFEATASLLFVPPFPPPHHVATLLINDHDCFA